MSKLISRSLTGFVFILSAAISTAGADDGPGDELAAYYAGNGFLQRGLHDMAIKEYRSFLAGHGGHEKAPMARYGLAVALLKSGKFAEASKEAAALTDSSFQFAVEVAVLRGQCAMATGQAENAIASLREVVENHREHKLAADASALLVEALYKTKRLDEAVMSARDSLAKWPNGTTAPRVQLLLAYTLFDQGKGRDAGALLDQFLAKGESGPQGKSALQLRGRIWLDEKAYGKALVAFEKAAKSPELAEECSYWMAKCELRQGEFAKAATQLAEAIKSYPQGALLAEMSFDRSVALVRGGEGEKAIPELRQLLDRFSEHALAADAMELLASTLHQAGKYEESAKVCRQFLKQFPERSQATTVSFIRAENAFLQEQFNEAERDYRQFLERFAKDERADLARFRLGLVLLKKKKPSEATELLETAAKSASKDARLLPAVMALANLNFDRGEWKAASERFGAYLVAAKDAVDLDEAMLKLGLCEARQGRNEEAIKRFDELAAKFPKSPQVAQATFERGQALMALGKMKEAAACFEGLMNSANSRFAPFARRHLAAIAMKDGDAKRAATLLAEASSGAGDELAAELLVDRGVALLAAGQSVEAQAAFDQFLSKNASHGRSAEARAHRAIALARQKKWSDATQALAEVDADKLPAPLQASLSYEKAWCLRETGKKQEAAAVYRGLIAGPEKGSLRRHAILELAALEQEAKHFKEAAELLTQLSDGPKGSKDEQSNALAAQATLRLGLCQFELGKFDAAATTLAEFLKNWPGDAQTASAGYYAGESLFKLGRFEAAIKALEKASHSDDAQLAAAGLLRMGEALAQLQRWPRSEEVFNEYLQRFASSEGWHQAMFGVGWARENQGRHDEAMECYRQVVTKHKGPTAARAQFQIGECLFARKKLEDAVRELLKVDILYAYPEWSAAAIYEAGRCFEAMNKSAEARDQFRTVTEKFHDSKWASMATQRISALGTIADANHGTGS